MLRATFLLLICTASAFASEVQTQLDDIVTHYRKSIVILSAEQADDELSQAKTTAVGMILFEENHQTLYALENALLTEISAAKANAFEDKLPQTDEFLDLLERKANLKDADKLAFRDLVASLDQVIVQANPSKKQAKWAQRISTDRQTLQKIQDRYSEEVTQIFERFATRGMVQRREAWEDYVAYVNTLYDADSIFAEYDTQSMFGGDRGSEKSALEIYGFNMPDQTFVLTFDDGPHHTYTGQVLDILKKHGVKAIFFEVGNKVGNKEDGTIVETTDAAIARRIVTEGHILANHTLSHKNLPKTSDEQLAQQLDMGKEILEKAGGRDIVLFRPPYGGRDSRVLTALDQRSTKAYLWNVDSRDWADPIPESIAKSVLEQTDKQGRGVLLFHDIHSQTIAALPLVLEGLAQRNYKLVLWDGEKVLDTAPTHKVAPVATDLYGESYAVIIGINDYKVWPKLQYAQKDATGIQEALIEQYGFKTQNITLLLNENATRENILKVLGDTLPQKVTKDDRVLVFYAGHGATRQLPSGSAKGYIIPVEADTENYQSQAISMTALQDINEAMPAKHVFFIMDACYSGIALTRGGAFAGDPRRYLNEVTRRIARQILTAGGADEQVSDHGPGGHSIFTWNVLQGLDGQADLNGDGFITGSELSAFVAPRVSSLSRQTPAFGNLIGSEGGDFVFQLHRDVGFLSEVSTGEDSSDEELSRARALLDDQEARNRELMEELAKMQARLADLEGSRGSKVTHDKASESQLHNALGLEEFRAGRLAAALTAFAKAAELDAQNAQAVNNLGYLYFTLEEHEKAQEWLEKTIAIDPGRYVALMNMGDNLEKMGRHDEAIEAYGKYMELAPADKASQRVRHIVEEAN